MNNPKICVYALALNEISNVDLFMSSVKEADLVLICDSGSTDGTQQRLRELGAVVYDISLNPWRFDQARNTSLSLIPGDYDVCVSLDFDETLEAGWKEEIHCIWRNHNGQVNRITYEYVQSWSEDGLRPMFSMMGDRIHSRNGYIWKYPCYEVLKYQKETELAVFSNKIKVLHRPDITKNRGYYLSLLENEVKDNPNDTTMSYHYGKELAFYNRNDDAIKELERYLSLTPNTNQIEMGKAKRLISQCFRNLKNFGAAKYWGMECVKDHPSSRDSWLELARSTVRISDWEPCYHAITELFKITQRPLEDSVDSWGFEPYDIGCLAAWNVGNAEESKAYSLEAYRLNPYDDRIKNNCFSLGLTEEDLSKIQI